MSESKLNNNIMCGTISGVFYRKSSKYTIHFVYSRFQDWLGLIARLLII